jgi:UDP:flavonoid glycosyltransferase YjiC (YdhE family)
MKIALVILGTRGDVQPMVALATGLMDRGHDVTIFAPPENEGLVTSNKCRFVPFGSGIKQAVSENPEKQKGGVTVTISPKEGKKIIGDQISLLPDLIRDTDMLLGAGIVMGVQTAADILNVPYRCVAFYPIILGTTKDDPLKNRMMFGFGKSLVNIFVKGFINKYRVLHSLPPIKDVWAHWLGEKVIIACDRELNPAHEGVAFPFMGDQFSNQKQIVKLGLGPDTCDFKKMTAESIAGAIRECVTNSKYKQAAAEMGQKLQKVNGIELTVELIEKEFNKYI